MHSCQNGERRDLMGLSCNTLDFFFGRQLFRPYEYGREQRRSCVFHLCISMVPLFPLPRFQSPHESQADFSPQGNFYAASAENISVHFTWDHLGQMFIQNGKKAGEYTEIYAPFRLYFKELLIWPYFLPLTRPIAGEMLSGSARKCYIEMKSQLGFNYFVYFGYILFCSFFTLAFLTSNSFFYFHCAAFWPKKRWFWFFFFSFYLFLYSGDGPSLSSV